MARIKDGHDGKQEPNSTFLVRDIPTDNLTFCILHGKNPEAIHNTHLQKLVFSAGFSGVHPCFAAYS